MVPSDSRMAPQIAQAASEFELRRSGHAPQSVSVVMSEKTLVITLLGALAPAEEGPREITGRCGQAAGVSPAIVHPFLRVVVRGNQADHRS